MNVAYNADCLAAMREMPDNAFDLAVVDPPYGLERFKSNDGGNSKKIKCFGGRTESWNNVKPSNEYFGQLFRVSKKQIIWGGNNFSLPESEYFIIWDKEQFMPSFAQCEFAWTNCKVPAKIFQCRSQDIGRIHPTQKPIKLYSWIYQNYAKPGDKILDTHLGSGSSRIAAYDAGLDFVGYEIDETYFRLQEERFARHTAQMNLFID